MEKELDFKNLDSKGLKLVYLEDLPLADRAIIAEQISAITDAEETMLYQTIEEILNKLTVAVVMNKDNDIISMCSVMEPGVNIFGHTVAEMGGMWTKKITAT